MFVAVPQSRFNWLRSNNSWKWSAEWFSRWKKFSKSQGAKPTGFRSMKHSREQVNKSTINSTLFLIIYFRQQNLENFITCWFSFLEFSWPARFSRRWEWITLCPLPNVTWTSRRSSNMESSVGFGLLVSTSIEVIQWHAKLLSVPRNLIFVIRVNKQDAQQDALLWMFASSQQVSYWRHIFGAFWVTHMADGRF